MKSVPQQSSSSLGSAAANSLGASASGAFLPIVATTSHYVLHSPPQGVFLPVDPASVSSSASEAAAATAHCEASLATQRQTLIAAYARCKKRGDRAGAKAVWENLHKVTNQMLGAA